MLKHPRIPKRRNTRLHVQVEGAVQGVGFRPHVYRLSRDLELTGWVSNSSQGVVLEVEGQGNALRQFIRRLTDESPPNARITEVHTRRLKPHGFQNFEIRSSEANGTKSAIILPDLATCPDCLLELFDKKNRRYRYPFINCTHCGPRFSIIDALPYDRPNTSMRQFVQCTKCQKEYDSPDDRRFHAQPNACPKCGPQIELKAPPPYGNSCGDEALRNATVAIREGKIIALKGVGGFQLIVDARNKSAVKRLRKRKGRGDKPFAMMCPSLQYANSICEISDAERDLLLSPEAPIALLKKRNHRFDHVAPKVRDYGIFLPYSPVHYLLLNELGFPVIATSANLSEEPICIDNEEAYQRLHNIADLFLVHNRPIVRHVDDSIARVLVDRVQILRRARGYAPLPIDMGVQVPVTIAVGAHLKNTVGIATGNLAFLSQHIGDLETAASYKAFLNSLKDLPRLYELAPKQVVHDLHPGYLSTIHAKSLELPTIAVQHHLAHVYSCIAENQLELPVQGISWDGTGYGEDGKTWGGESFIVSKEKSYRFSTLKNFALIGGDNATRQPKRTAISVLQLAYPEGLDMLSGLACIEKFSTNELALFEKLSGSSHTPQTSSMGRLFDAVASILDICHINEFEGQAAMALETFASYAPSDLPPYPFSIAYQTDSSGNTLWVFDWRPLIRKLTDSFLTGEAPEYAARRFHNTLVIWILNLAARADIRNVALTGGCFQNRLLCESAANALSAKGFKPHFHHLVPPNDGGIALGQLYAASLPQYQISSDEHPKESCA